jgi:hypothetical protein
MDELTYQGLANMDKTTFKRLEKIKGMSTGQASPASTALAAHRHFSAGGRQVLLQGISFE